MRAGLLRDIIELQHSRTVRDAMGSQQQTWQTYWRGRAWVRFSNGGRAEVNGEMLNTITRKVTIRHQPGIELQDRLKIGGEYYAILSKDDSSLDRTVTFIVELINE